MLQLDDTPIFPYLHLGLGFDSPSGKELADVSVCCVTFGLFLFTLFPGCFAEIRGNLGWYFTSGRLTYLSTFALDGQILFTVRLIGANTVPLLTAIVGVTLAIVVYDKVILVEAFSHNVFVAVFVDFFVKIMSIVDLVRIKGLLARLAKGSKFFELCSLVDLRHDGLIIESLWKGEGSIGLKIRD